MTDQELQQLAREYAESLDYSVVSRATTADIVTDALRNILRDHCIVKKSEVKEEYEGCRQFLGTKDEEKAQAAMWRLEEIFGTELFEERSGNHFREVGKMVDKGIVCVKWLDSYGVQSGWREIDDFKANQLEITSIGKIIYEDDDVISLAHNFADETENTVAQANGIMTIPRVCIRQIISCVFSCPEPESTQMRQPS